MGLGKMFTRNIKYDVTDTNTGAHTAFTVFTDGVGAYPDWSQGAYRGGMAIPGAWRASMLLSDLLGAIPWHAYRERAGQPVQKLTPTPALLDQPSPPDTRMTSFSSWAFDLIWHGNAIGVIADRDAQGYPLAVTLVPADRVQVRRVRPGDQIRIPEGEIEYRIGNRSFSADEVIHIKGPCNPGDLRGWGVLENHLNTLDLAGEQNRQARSLSRHGVPTGVLKVANPDATKDSLTEAKTAWLSAQRDRTVAVLNATTDFQPLSWNPEQLQLLEARKFSLHEIALIFGLPLSFLGVEQSSRTYTNQEQEGLNLIKFTLAGHLARFEQTLTQQFPRGTWVKANLDAILRADTKTRYEAHKTAIEAGFLTVDEVRELEELPPLPPQNGDNS